jgi:ribosome biogenesis protein BMS1
MSCNFPHLVFWVKDSAFSCFFCDITPELVHLVHMVLRGAATLSILKVFILQQAKNELPSFDDIDAEDCTKFSKVEQRDWSNEELISSIRDCFVTGDWSKAALRGKKINENGEDEEIYGDFEDLETGEIHMSQAGEDAEGSDGVQKVGGLEVEERRLKKLALKAKFDAQYP